MKISHPLVFSFKAHKSWTGLGGTHQSQDLGTLSRRPTWVIETQLFETLPVASQDVHYQELEAESIFKLRHSNARCRLRDLFTGPW